MAEGFSEEPLGATESQLPMSDVMGFPTGPAPSGVTGSSTRRWVAVLLQPCHPIRTDHRREPTTTDAGAATPVTWVGLSRSLIAVHWRVHLDLIVGGPRRVRGRGLCPAGGARQWPPIQGRADAVHADVLSRRALSRYTLPVQQTISISPPWRSRDRASRQRQRHLDVVAVPVGDDEADVVVEGYRRVVVVLDEEPHLLDTPRSSVGGQSLGEFRADARS